MHIASELVVSASHAHPAVGREAELRRLSSPELLALVRLSGAVLTPEELRLIHDLAIERLTQNGGPPSEGADELSREVMQAAVRRIT